jgi:hypothetical protein
MKSRFYKQFFITMYFILITLQENFAYNCSDFQIKYIIIVMIHYHHKIKIKRRLLYINYISNLKKVKSNNTDTDLQYNQSQRTS